MEAKVIQLLRDNLKLIEESFGLEVTQEEFRSSAQQFFINMYEIGQMMDKDALMKNTETFMLLKESASKLMFCLIWLAYYVLVFSDRFYGREWDGDATTECIIRSGIQYFRDFYRDIDTDGSDEKLDDYLTVYFDGEVEFLDDYFKDWVEKDRDDSIFEGGPRAVPDSHWWWKP